MTARPARPNLPDAEPAWRRWGRALAGAALPFLLPSRCPACGAEISSDAPLCAPCWERIPRADLALCVRCLARERDPAACTRHPGFRVGVAWVYDERAAAVVAAFKYEAREDLAERLAPELMQAPRPLPRPDLVAAVPLHAARRRERGYDQAARLARAWARHAGLPFLDGALERVRPTRVQARLGARARRANVAGAFRVREPQALAGRKVVLVDDVVTTGATLEAALDTLAACGAETAGVALAWAQ